ncbi:DUF5126 domain-containing protein [Sphingobacterium alkalisoli]|uniref:DUF5126 domain-containing protein n=1 Tax=Sphingobacterium alkalisoli TaxID=1874115 RepID=A0A4U0HBX9_9SPHI|nr:DUF5000 domain-containing lipoprotein [Sphingobacterium alkalisoli]TJY68112.1 DUF5126 domain-containing protein [Sphingobacterium alkalisoli]GGH08985.1 hypothetical protein GCM10011418_06740 [Sphingobacterium alkalisoli]
MKILELSIGFFSLFMLLACSEEKHEPLFLGETPNAVSQYSVENLPGAAAVTFKLDDPRTAYVKAVYTVEHGVTREAKASKYDNKLMVDGFAQSREYSVALYAIGKDEQESEPVYITVHPGTPPYQTVLAELNVAADWGGGRVTGENPTSAQLMIGVVKKDPTSGEWVDVEVFFTESPSFNFNFRNQTPVETEFGVYTRDPWQNFSDTVSSVFEPWEEIKLPLTHQNFNQIVLAGDAIGQASYGLRRLFDGIRFSWADGYYSLNDGTPFPKVITIDLLQTYQLSRFKYWQNGNLYYQSANAKHIRIWGNTTLDPDFDKWHLLGEWDDWRPSKRPPTTGNPGLTEEDLAAAQAGNDFDFQLEIPGVRYIRIETLSTWEPRTQVYYPELEFWGRPIK